MPLGRRPLPDGLPAETRNRICRSDNNYPATVQTCASPLSSVLNASAFSSIALNRAGLSRVAFRYLSGNQGAIDKLTVFVPEPGTLALPGLGLAGIGTVRRGKPALAHDFRSNHEKPRPRSLAKPAKKVDRLPLGKLSGARVSRCRSRLHPSAARVPAFRFRIREKADRP